MSSTSSSSTASSRCGELQADRVWHLAANSDISYGTKYTDFV